MSSTAIALNRSHTPARSLTGADVASNFTHAGGPIPGDGHFFAPVVLADVPHEALGSAGSFRARPPSTASRASALAAAQPSGRGIEVVRGHRCHVVTSDGRRLLDLTSGMATLNLGHGHPEILDSLSRQAAELMHAGGAYAHRPMAALAERLAAIAPGGISSFCFAASGCEAVEGAIRVARAATGRTGVVAFRGGYHGRTLGAAACTTSLPRPATQPEVAAVAVASFPRPSEWNMDPVDAADLALADLDALHRDVLTPAETACYVVEPIQGHGGCNPAGRHFLEGLRERADRYGALLVFDEVQTGLGRLGGWTAAALYGVTPDVIALGKALGGGLPLSAFGAAAQVMAALGDGGHGSTFGGSPLACAVGLEALHISERDRLPARAALLGERACRRLGHVVRRHPNLGELRGVGLMLGLTVVDPGTMAERGDLALDLALALEDEGVYALCSGPGGSVLRLLPPLTISDSEWAFALEALERAATRVLPARATLSATSTN